MNSRRNFLKFAGVGITGSLINPISSHSTILEPGKRNLKIGLLLPKSNEHPEYPDSMLKGLKLGFADQGTPEGAKTEIVTEYVNYGTPSFAKRKVKQLISENGVQVIVALINTEAAFYIGDIAKKSKVPVIVVNAGENIPDKPLKENPFLFFNTLSLSHASYMAGKYAVKKYGKSITVVTSLYDSGFDALITFRLGVESEGGSITNTHISPDNSSGFISETLSEIQKSESDSIFSFLNGQLSDNFFRELSFSNINIPVLTTSFAIEDNRLVQIRENAKGIHNFSSWTNNLNINENRFFVKEYRNKYSKNPDSFSMLGFETGQIIQKSFSDIRSDNTGYSLSKAIKNCKIDSPRGNISINKETGIIQNPLYLCKTQKANFGSMENVVLDNFPADFKTEKAFKILDSNLRSGWITPYLFI